MKNITLLIFVLIAFVSCKKEPLTWDVDAIAPLMRTKLQVQQAIPDSLTFVGDSGLLFFTYSGELFNFNLDSVLEIPDTTIRDEFQLPIGTVTLPPGQTFLSDTINNTYDIANAKLTLLRIQSGKISFTISSNLEGPSVIEYSIPSATKNGQPFFIKENIPPSSGGAPIQRTFTYDVSDYDFNLTGENNNNYNVISTAYRAYIDSNSTPVTINAGDKFNIANTLQSITPKYARGYFGKELITESGSDTASDFFNQIGGGVIDLATAQVVLNVINQVGIDASVLIKNLTGLNTQNNTQVSLFAPITQAPLNINRATENFSNTPPVNASQIQVPLNESNSNIANFISNLPNVLSYQLEMTLNPLEDISNTNDFVNINTGLKVGIEATAPMHFSSTNLVILDTSDFEMETDGRKEIERIQGGYLLINSTNWYPINFGTQFYMLDQNKQVIDSIMPQNAIIPGSILTGTDKVEIPETSQIKAPLTTRQIAHLYQTKHIITKLNFTTTGNSQVKLFEDYFIDLRIAGDINYMITVE